MNGLTGAVWSGHLARLLQGSCSLFNTRVGAGAFLWFAELQGFVAETVGWRVMGW